MVTPSEEGILNNTIQTDIRRHFMYMYMFGADSAHIESFASDMKAHGMNAVVAGNFSEYEVDVLAKNSLDAYLCYGAFGRGGFDDTHLSVDYEGRQRIWFGSGCPGDTEIADFHLGKVIEKAKTKGIKGIFSDGARFASFASSEGRDSFWTCFCPRCTARAEKMGFDLESVRFMYKTGHRSDGLRIMTEFRNAAMKEYFEHAFREIKKSDAGLLVGAFIFPASLAKYVGQDRVTDVDILAPMLYRAYPHAEGPACLNHEWSAAAVMLDIDWQALGMKTKASTPDELLSIGFEPEMLRTESAALKGLAPKLMPIIQIEDGRLSESISCIRASGADGCGFLSYSKENMSFFR